MMTLLYALITTSVMAQNYAIGMQGMVCEFCADGLSKNVRDLSFIDKSKLDKGIRVDIEHQKRFVSVKKDTAFDKQALLSTIKNGGYEPTHI